MLKRVLVAFENSNEVDQVVNYAQMLSSNYQCQVVGIYIKDIRKYEVVPPMAEGMIIDSSNSFAMREWDILEEKKSQDIKKLFKEKIPNGEFIIEEGIGVDNIIQKMRAFDLLIVPKSEYINSNLKYLLKFHVKPIIIVPKLEKYSLDKILLLDDKGMRANGAIFNFFNIFTDIKKIDSLSIGLENKEEKLVEEYFKLKEIEITEHIEENLDNLKEYEKEYNLFIMGNLRYNFLLEKLIGKFGVKLLENSRVPIFIA